VFAALRVRRRGIRSGAARAAKVFDHAAIYLLMLFMLLPSQQCTRERGSEGAGAVQAEKPGSGRRRCGARKVAERKARMLQAGDRPSRATR